MSGWPYDIDQTTPDCIDGSPSLPYVKFLLNHPNP